MRAKPSRISVSTTRRPETSPGRRALRDARAFRPVGGSVFRPSGRRRQRAGDLLSCYLRNMGRDTKGQDKIVRSDEHNSRGIEFADRGWLDEEYPAAHLNLGMTYADLNQGEEAKSEFKAAIELDPQDPLARHELAAMLMDEGDYRGAIALLNEVVRLEPENYEGWLDLGISYAQKGFYQEAERCYAKARELNPDDVLLNYNVAALYSLWDRRADALTALRKALEKEPAKVRSWLAADPMFDGLKGAPEFEQLVSAK